LLDTEYVFLNFEAKDFTEPKMREATWRLPHASHTMAALGTSFDAWSVSEAFSPGKISIPLSRHGDTSSSLHIRYATSDLSARGVSPEKAAACCRLPVEERAAAACGDYVSSTGQLTFPPGRQRRDLVIPLMNDACPELAPEFFQVHLFLPGGPIPAGEGFSIVIRIDDDDAADGTALCLQPHQPHTPPNVF
jgi:hypothetical protein